MQKNWYLRTKTQNEGPFSEPEIRARLLADAFLAGDEVRQGDSDWRSAAEVKTAFRQIYQTGWYVKAKGKVAGPFVTQKILELHRAGLFRSNTLLRHGFASSWQEADEVITMLQQKKTLLAQLADTCAGDIDLDALNTHDTLSDCQANDTQ